MMELQDERIDRRFGASIQIWRQARDMGITAASEKLGIPADRLMELEQGTAKRGVTMPELKAVVRVYEVSYGIVYGLAIGKGGAR